MYYLYYVEEIDFRWIEKRMKQNWIDLPNSNIQHMFKKMLWWEARHFAEITDQASKKNKIKYEKWYIKQLNKTRQEQTQEEILTLLADAPSISLEITQEDLWKFKNKRQRVNFLLQKLLILQENEDVQVLLKKLHSRWFGCDRQKNILNWIIKKAFDLDLKINSKYTYVWLND